MHLERKEVSGKLDKVLDITIERVIAMMKSACIVLIASSILTGSYRDNEYKEGVHITNKDISVHECEFNAHKPKTLVLIRKN